MDLLIIKCDGDYVRIKGERFITVGLDKASVFPVDQLDAVKAHLKHIQDSGFPEAAIFRLTLNEAPL